ncbi:Swt1 family HEPN domain-containing protein [Polaribacter dokdonensis]|uniref:Swt1-like HEPN domain-containing protein n=1 Tax=Polaribacter dokdonensis DSW-5 TaxID=1300348 RepID=A0A1H5F8W7_9FLAO|nr:Swt1 family HEPN domain-containing protein [Polaribacter dokdonensis]SED99654.1 hypothetical protein SAMN05444353_0279 [Polaribacter dokdonensis DSW-5]
MKIGQLVKTYVPLIFNYCSSKDNAELDRLSDKEYSKKIFGINYPFCARIDAPIMDNESKRFWKQSFYVQSKEYRVSSQWIISHKPKFLKYLLQLNIIDNEKFQELNKQVVHNANLKQSIQISNNNISVEPKNKLEKEAFDMSKHYQKFYYLERSIRILIEEVMIKAYGVNWWSSIDDRVKRNVERNLDYELDTSHTKRSERAIDYTTFGDLRKIINNHWEVFSEKFSRNLNSVNEVLIDLNRLRVSIAHCSPLAEKEVKRLEIRLDDWSDVLVSQKKKTAISFNEFQESAEKYVNQNKYKDTSFLNTDNSFIVTLGKKYYEDGFFNVRVRYSEQFGEDSSKIKIQLGENSKNFTIGKVNRTANTNATPRIFAGPLYKKWVQAHFMRGDIFRVEVIEKDFIKLSQIKDQ